MTPTSFFTIVIKIFGLYFLKEIILLISQLGYSFSVFSKSSPYDNPVVDNMRMTFYFISIVTIIIYFILSYLSLFRTESVIKKLKLEKGFEQADFNLNISTDLILTIVLLIVSGVILLNEIPNLFKNIFSLIQEKRITNNIVKNNYSNIIVSITKIAIGLLLIGERKRIISFIRPK